MTLTMVVTQTVSVSLIMLIIFLSQSSVEGIKCFQCNSLNHSDCLDLKQHHTNSYHYRDCEEEKVTSARVFCRKIVQKIVDRNNLIRVVRKCSWVQHPRLSCYNVNNKDHDETVCQCFTDGCNSATGQQVSLVTAVFSLAVGLLSTVKLC